MYVNNVISEQSGSEHFYYLVIHVPHQNQTCLIAIQSNSADPDEMQHVAASHLSLHCLSMYQFMTLLSRNGYK